MPKIVGDGGVFYLNETHWKIFIASLGPSTNNMEIKISSNNSLGTLKVKRGSKATSYG